MAWLPSCLIFLLKYPLMNQAFLQKVKFPVTLFHGSFDEVIPFENSEKLQGINPELFRLVSLPEGHRGVIFSPVFQEAVSKLLK